MADSYNFFGSFSVYLKTIDCLNLKLLIFIGILQVLRYDFQTLWILEIILIFHPCFYFFKATQHKKNVVLRENMRITVNNEKRRADLPSKKLTTEEIVKEKERLLQLEKVYANKIRQLKQGSVVTPSVPILENNQNKDDIVAVVKKEIPRLEKIALNIDTIDLTDENEVDERPCKRRRSLMELNPSTKPNVEVKAARLSRSSQSSIVEDNQIEVDFPEGKSLLRLHRQQVRDPHDGSRMQKCLSVKL